MQNSDSNSSNFSVVKILTYPFVGLIFIVNILSSFCYNLIKYTFKGIKYIILGAIAPLTKNSKNKEIKTSKKENIIKEDKTKKAKQPINKNEPIIEKTKENLTEKPKEKNTKKESKKDSFKIIEDYKLDPDILKFVEEQAKNRRKKEKNEKRKKIDSETYINEKVKLEKPTFGEKISAVFAGIALALTSKGNKVKNNTFAKNRRNKKDMQKETLLIDFEGEDAIKSDKKVLYEYVAKDITGRVVKDYFNAYSKVEVHSYLLSEGYEVYSIKTNKFIQIMHSSTSTNNKKFKNKDLIFFLTQLSTYIKAGIPLVESLRIVARQYKKPAYQKIFKSVIYELTVGESFSSAMEKQGTAFPKLLINMVKTAEMTGSLPEVLDDMSNYYSEVEASRKQMVTAMTYPTLVFVFAIAVMTFVMVYVVPQFVEIYESMDTKLPKITIVILKMSDFLRNKWYIVLLIVVLLIVSFVCSYKKIKGFRTFCQWTVMHVPVFNNVIIYNEVTLFTKTFSSLLAHNVPITDCMEILNKITNNEIYKMLILDTITNLARGGKISDAFKDNWAFPVPAYEMIVTGETTGELSEMMSKVSEYYQDLHKNSVTRIKTFIEPILTIFLTAGVGIIILSIIVPMFEMYSAVQDME